MTQRSLYVLAPGTGPRWFCGGLLTMMRLVDVLRVIRDAQLVTYRDREPGRPFIDDALDPNGIYIVAWGPHVSELVAKLAGRNVAYWANSYGWRFRLPPSVPILAASRFTMGLWGEDAPNAPIYYLPNPLGDEFVSSETPKDIDVIHVGRKSSAYLRDQLIPRLKSQLHVQDIQSHVPSLATLFQRSKVYLYDSRDFWVGKGVSEGFGLQPLEAMGCGCTVFSSVNAGLSDFIDPGVNAQKLGCFSLEHDVARILLGLDQPIVPSCHILDEHRPPAIRKRWLALEPWLLRDFDAAKHLPVTIKYDTRGWRTYTFPQSSGFGRWRTAGERVILPMLRRIAVRMQRGRIKDRAGEEHG